MSIISTLIIAGKHARDMVRVSKLGQADRAKFSRGEVFSMVHDNLLLGRLNVCEALLKNHQADPYKSVDEFIGELQIILVKANEDLRQTNPHYTVSFKLEDLLTERIEA